MTGAAHFPGLHARPARGWVNDPNGIGRWDGRWHVMFQHNPYGTQHALIHWGHLSSADLLTWRDEGTALAPRPGTIDAAGVWSGVATLDGDGRAALVYTATPAGPQEAGAAVARRAPDGTWVPGDRFAAPPPADPRLRDVRDPFLVTVEGRRYAIQGGGTTDGTPLVLVYDARDLGDWRLLGTLLDGRDPLAGELADAEIWECPQLVRLDGRWVLVVSRFHSHGGVREEHAVSALVGGVDLAAGRPRFRVRAGGPLDDGPDFYAPQVVAAGDRVLAWGWSWEGRGTEADRRTRSPHDVAVSGWSGTLTHPRELFLAADGRVGSRPARELVGLRRGAAATVVPAGAPAWEAAADGGLEVLLRGSDGDHPIWRSASATAHRVLVDGSIVEAFGADGRCATVRAYPRPDDRWVLRSVVGSAVRVWALDHGPG